MKHYTLILALFLTACTKQVPTPRIDEALKEAVPLERFGVACLRKAMWVWELPDLFGTHEDINGFTRIADSITYNFFLAAEKREDCENWTQPLGISFPEPIILEIRRQTVYRADSFTNHIIQKAAQPDRFYIYTGNDCINRLKQGYCLKATMWAQVHWGGTWSNQQATQVTQMCWPPKTCADG